MQLTAAYSFYYGIRGPMDEEHPIVRKGETFAPIATSQASADEVGRHLIRAGAAVDPGKGKKA